MGTRPIDASGFERALIADMSLYGEKISGDEAYSRALLLLAGAPTLTPPSEPLSIEQLREMDGAPVYIVFFSDADGEKLQFWALVAVDEWGEVYLMNNLGGSSAYEEVWADIEAIYRRPPKGRRPPHD